MAEPLEIRRKQLLSQQTKLRSLLARPKNFKSGLALLLNQHAALHSSDIAHPAVWSYEDAILEDLCENEVRCLPAGAPHSIAWLLWHMARCEDITMNMLVAGTRQLLDTNHWYAKLKVRARDTGNAMDPQEIASFSAKVDVEALRAYRLAVGMRTREIIRQLEPADLKDKIQSERIRQVMEHGAVLEAARGISDYWSRQTIAGLLLTPATRHNLIHLNEAFRVKQTLRRGLK